MDDFAQSREPDDLFSDDIEPTEPQIVQEPPKLPSQAPPNPSVPAVQAPQAPRTRGANTNRGGRRGGLASSAHADPAPQPQAQSKPQPQPQTPSAVSTAPQDAVESSPTPAKPTPAAPAVEEPRTTSVRGDRSATGPAKPTKKTEAELSLLMNAMALKNAAKTEAHARAEKDQATFLQREQQAAAKRTEERKAVREMDMERARNRERKMGAKGGREWDSEKVEADIVDGKNRGNSSMYTRGAHGGVSGGPRGGLANSRFGGDEDEEDDFARGSRGGRGGRGRGRGRGDLFQGDVRGRGDFRGGRGGRVRGGQFNNPTKVIPSLTAETDFPALPTTKKTPAASKSEDKNLPVMSPVGDGNWAEEMATPVEKV